MWNSSRWGWGWSAASCGKSNEPSSSVEDEEFHDCRETWLSQLFILKYTYFFSALLLSLKFVCNSDDNVCDEAGCYVMSAAVCFRRRIVTYLTTHKCFARNLPLDLPSVANFYIKLGRLMIHAIRRLHSIMKVWVQFQDNSWGISGRNIGTGTGIFLIASVFTCR